ncbi:MAG: tRNA (adenosine(37)-N6)-dimethylallyltransferase MiaA [Magnetococcales bacterium]|nr:tRNA (adenosine(37)-N6)-dimethylallyltransferase MiaA [Magnetococcales bacterium]
MKILVILGPTASGKTRLAVQLAQGIAGEILSADSRQVYRGLDIGTGKDLEEYGPIPYHLIDVVDPGEAFDLFQFQQRCLALLPEIQGRGGLPILVGGTGLYLEALIRGYRLAPARADPALRAHLHTLSDDALTARLLTLKPTQHNTTDLETRERAIRAIEIAQATLDQNTPDSPPVSHSDPDHDFLILGMRWERAILRQRIADRLQQRLETGLIEEVADLLNRGVSPASLEALGLEYRFVTRFVQGALDRAELFDQLVQAIRQFAKRQETWFRRMERHGIRIHWLEAAKDPLHEARTIMGRIWPEFSHFSSPPPPTPPREGTWGSAHPDRTAPDTPPR